MKRYLLAIVLLLPFILQAKVAVEKPRSKQPTAFAIVVDQATYDKTAPQIHAYRDVLEADGLSTYILRDNWQTPEQVREQLIALMRKTAKRSPLEGVVFVGDIPIAMVRNAQHLTTAFKMDEDNFPMIQSSVPSDRYYATRPTVCSPISTSPATRRSGSTRPSIRDASAIPNSSEATNTKGLPAIWKRSSPNAAKSTNSTIW